MNRRAAGWMAIAASTTLLLIVAIRSAWLCDDAYFTFRTVENLVDGHGPRWNVGARVQVYTHPLWMLLLAGVRSLGVPIHAAAWALSAACLVGVIAAVVRTANSHAAASIALVALACSKSFVDFTSGGLETPLSMLLAAVWVVEATRDGTKKPLLLGLLVSALLLCRPDHALLVGPATLWLLWKSTPQERWRLAGGLVPLLAWEAFSLLYYGSPVPNTAMAKLHSTASLATKLKHGGWYVLGSLQLDWLTLPVTGVAFAASSCHRRPAESSILIGVLLHLAWLVSIGGDFMAGRFFATTLVVALVLAVRSTRLLPDRHALVAASALLVLGLAGPRSPLLAGADYGDEDGGWTRQRPIDYRLGVVDERAWYFQQTGLLRSARSPLPRLGERVAERRPGERTVKVGFGGMDSFRFGRDVWAVDVQGLGDPFVARLLPAPGEPFRAGHGMRAVPERYVRSLEVRGNLFVEEDLRQLLSDVEAVAVGPVLAEGRAGAIWRLRRGLQRGGETAVGGMVGPVVE